MKIPRKSRKKFAQQLVEFLLVAPFLVIILGILTEYAYALNCNTTLSDGLKMVTGSIYSQIRVYSQNDPIPDDVAIQNKVLADLRAYLQANNVPTREENTLTVSRTMVGSNAVFVANYRYVSAFTLPNVFFHFLPDSFNFQAISIIPRAFMQGNSGYRGGISSTDLDKIWIGTNFSGLSDFDKAKNGAMSARLSDNLNQLLFLVMPANATTPPTYAIVNWKGVIQPFALNIANGNLYTCISNTCTNTGTKFLSAYNAYHTFIFTNDKEVPIDLTNLHYYWTHVKGSCNDTDPTTCIAIPAGTKISDANVDGILKRSLGLINTSSFLSTNGGNFDNIAVNTYNNEVAPTGAIYTIDTFGSDVFVHFESIANITNGQIAPNVNYNFGARDKDNY